MKSNFFLLCSLAPHQQVKLNGHSRLGCRGKVLLCNTGKKKRLKPASFSDQPDSWPGFSMGTLSLGYHRKLLQAARLFRSDLSLLWLTVPLGESKGLWRVLSVQSKKLIFSFVVMHCQTVCCHVSAAPTVYGGLVQCDTTTGRSVSAWYQRQELLWRRRPGDDTEFFRDFFLTSAGKSKSCWK